jgi:hypothetical protein
MPILICGGHYTKLLSVIYKIILQNGKNLMMIPQKNLLQSQLFLWYQPNHKQLIDTPF